jgi:hypothetical protein
MNKPVTVKYPLSGKITVKLVPASNGSVLCMGCIFRPVRNCVAIEGLPSCINQPLNHVYKETS